MTTKRADFVSGGLLATGLLLAAAVAGCSDDNGSERPAESESFAETGPHLVGTKVTSEGTLRMRAWYPTQAVGAGAEYRFRLQLPGFEGSSEATALGTALADAEVSGEGLPLVVLSHGYSLNPEWYAPLAEHLASHGLIVLAPQHLEPAWEEGVVAASVTRPLEVSATIDAALSGPLARHVDADRVAVIGHSYGGYSALAVAGAKLRPSSLHERCEADDAPAGAAFLCAPFANGEDSLADAFGIEAPADGHWPSLRDERVKAIVPMAGDAYLFGPDGLAHVEVPVLAIGGTADTGTPFAWGPALAFEHAGSEDRRLVAMNGGEHFLPMADCADLPFMDDLPAEIRGYICDDPVFSKAVAHRYIHHYTTAFLLETLKQDPRARQALRQPQSHDLGLVDYQIAGIDRSRPPERSEDCGRRTPAVARDTGLPCSDL